MEAIRGCGVTAFELSGEPLTAREREVLTLVVAGLTGRQIAAELGVSRHTVRSHMDGIFAKVCVPNRTVLTAWALLSNTVSADDVRAVWRRWVSQLEAA